MIIIRKNLEEINRKIREAGFENMEAVREAIKEKVKEVKELKKLINFQKEHLKKQQEIMDYCNTLEKFINKQTELIIKKHGRKQLSKSHSKTI